MYNILITLFLAFVVSSPSFAIADNFEYTSNNVKSIRSLQVLNVPSQSPSSAKLVSTLLSGFSDKSQSNATKVNFSNSDISVRKADKSSHADVESIMGLSLFGCVGILFFALSIFLLISTKRKEEQVQEVSNQNSIEDSTIQSSASTCCNRNYFFTRSSSKKFSNQRQNSTKPNKEDCPGSLNEEKSCPESVDGLGDLEEVRSVVISYPKSLFTLPAAESCPPSIYATSESDNSGTLYEHEFDYGTESEQSHSDIEDGFTNIQRGGGKMDNF